MPRIARAVIPEIPHHLTQRGLNRQPTFFSEEDHHVYLALVRASAERFGADLLGYCLMPNHVHWIVVPQRADSLARAFGDAHGRYASYANAKLCRSGHFWQNRFFSCALDRAHLWTALRYVERNPLRARLVEDPATYRWSSAAAHMGHRPLPIWLQREPMRSTFTEEQWSVYLKSDTFGDAELTLRNQTYTGRPVGAPGFLESAECTLGRTLAKQRGGRPPNQSASNAFTSGTEQNALFEVA